MLSTLPVDASYESLTDNFEYLRVRCEALPLTASFLPALQAHIAEIDTTAAAERKLQRDVFRAAARVALVDEEVDATVDVVVHAILVITRGDRDDPLYLHFLGNQRPSDVKEPVLGDELAKVRGWVPSLVGSPHASLSALAPVLQQKVAAADTATADLTNAQQALKTFREVGPRKALVDKINALRKTIHGELGAIAHSHPEANLPSDFAERCFLRSHRKRKPTRSELSTKIATAKNAVVTLEAQLEELELELKAEASAEAQSKAEALEKQIQAAEKKVAAAQAKVDALKSKTSP